MKFEKTFYEFSGLTTVNPWMGVEVVAEKAFGIYKSLKYIRIPSTVKAMCDDAFGGCMNLTSVVVKHEFERIVSSYAMQSWWIGACTRGPRVSIAFSSDEELGILAVCHELHCRHSKKLRQIHTIDT